MYHTCMHTLEAKAAEQWATSPSMMESGIGFGLRSAMTMQTGALTSPMRKALAKCACSNVLSPLKTRLSILLYVVVCMYYGGGKECSG